MHGYLSIGRGRLYRTKSEKVLDASDVGGQLEKRASCGVCTVKLCTPKGSSRASRQIYVCVISSEACVHTKAAHYANKYGDTVEKFIFCTPNYSCCCLTQDATVWHEKGDG